MNLIYTAIFGKYDKLWEPKVNTPDWQYICYTDQNFDSDIWQVIKIDPPHKDLTKASKYIKIMKVPENKDDLFIWVDGSIEIQGNLNEFVSEIPECDLCMQKHPFNKTINEELDACIRMNKDNKFIMQHQVERYAFNQPYQFTQNNIIVKREGIDRAMHTWWKEVDHWSKRDQLSFVWAMQQTNQKYCTFSNQLADKYFFWHKFHEN